MYIDESGMNDNDFYPYVYNPKGSRYYEAHPGHYTNRLSMIGALCEQQFQAPFMFSGHCNTAMFEAYIEQVLVPTLTPGIVVVMDNASFHKSERIRKLIESAECQLLYLPPYSPDLNPIEHYWYKIKTSIRKLRRDTTILLEDAMCTVLKQLAIA